MAKRNSHCSNYSLLKAASEGSVDFLRELLDNDCCQVDLVDKELNTALMLSASKGHLQCARLLITYGANVNLCKPTGANALFYAAEGNHLDVVQLLLHSGLLVDELGGIALFVASQNGYLNIVQTLLEAGCDVNHSTDDASALFVAVQNGHLNVARLLLHNNADVNKSRQDGTTPLWIACQMGHEDIVKELLKFGAQDGATPLFKAAHKGNARVVQTLLDHGASVDLLANGESALHAACLFGNLEVAKILIHAKANVHLRNKSGETALQLAEQLGYDSIINLLNRFSEQQPFLKEISHTLL